MNTNANNKFLRKLFVALSLISLLLANGASTETKPNVSLGNFGLPGIVDLPTARRLPDGELVFTHQNHKYLFMNGLSFQALPRLGVSFRYGGQGRGGSFAYGRVNWDRSFDAHISIMDEKKYFPALSIGLRDFIGTGWYSSEYIVGTKSIGNIEITAGLGFGRLAGRNKISNPFINLSPRFKTRDANIVGRGGTLGTINWFHGDTSLFYGINYNIGNKIALSVEYTSDIMYRESYYSEIKSPWNFGVSVQVNDYVNLAAQYLHGSEASVTAKVAINPGRPPLLGGKELAPVPMRIRNTNTRYSPQTNEKVIRKVLDADLFLVHHLKIHGDTATIVVTNTKFRSIAQAIGRISSTFQRFTSNDVKFVDVSFHYNSIQTARYYIDLAKITDQQFNPKSVRDFDPSIKAINPIAKPLTEKSTNFSWGLGPYIAHRLFNPDLPLSMETGLEFVTEYEFAPGLKLSGAFRKSLLTNLTDNKRRSNSNLPHVHSDWPLYDIAGQNGHIHALKLSYTRNFYPGIIGTVQAGLLEPFYAGFGGEILYKPARSPLAIGLDIHQVRKRDYDMKLDLLEYETTVGHLSAYYDVGGMFNLEINAGRYLAGDWGATTTISRKFGSGWEVGGYATLTDVPFNVFGEGSFDKAIFVSLPIDWITSSPNKTRRSLILRPITRDGGANLASARKLYKQIERSQNAEFKREYGRLWK